MRILHTTPFVPYPPDSGGKLVSYHLLRGLAGRGHDISLIAPLRRPGDREGISRIHHLVSPIPVSCGPLSALRIAARVALGGESLRIARHRLAEVARCVHQTMAEREFNVVVLDSLFTAYLAPLLQRLAPELPRVLIAHNIESLLFRRYLAQKPALIRAVGRVEVRRIVKAEEAALRAVGRVIALSEVDSAQFRKTVPEADYIALYPGTETFPGEKIPAASKPLSALFLGNFRWAPNRDAARWLAEDIFPSLRHRIPAASLLLAGEDPDGRIASLHDPAQGVFVLGRVESARETIREAALFVVPLRVGSGVRLKILEAMANERPVLSTTMGFEGFPFDRDKHLVVADDAEAFAERAAFLLSNADEAGTIASAGRAMVEEKFAWERVVPRFEEAIAG
jgi:glycosyltransferase involved in cell wall biosynthesis